MSGAVTILSAGPSVTVQDLGRSGQVALGLSQGGAMDRLALLEAAALLQSDRVFPALELAGFGGKFQISADTRIALTGAPMVVSADGSALGWNQTHAIAAGTILEIGACRAGTYGYLTFGGGLLTAENLNSRATHLTAGLGSLLQAGDVLPLGRDPRGDAPQMGLTTDPRFEGGELRVLSGPQTSLFSGKTLDDFFGASFTKSNRANRQGVGLDHPNLKFTSEIAAGLASDFIAPGDIQQTGDGVPYVLMAECQTTGGYPRIGTVIPEDLPRLAQAQMGAKFSFRHITQEEADRVHRPEAAVLKQLTGRVAPVVRNPADIQDLLGYEFISGVTAGDELDGD